jgi:hypothetical protein
VAHHHRADAHHTTPEFVEIDGRQGIN